MLLIKKCCVSCNQNEWSTEKNIKDWHINIQDNYFINSDLIKDDYEGFLILDKKTCNIIKEIVNDFTYGNREISFIPGSNTRFF